MPGIDAGMLPAQSSRAGLWEGSKVYPDLFLLSSGLTCIPFLWPVAAAGVCVGYVRARRKHRLCFSASAPPSTQHGTVPPRVASLAQQQHSVHPVIGAVTAAAGPGGLL